MAEGRADAAHGVLVIGKRAPLLVCVCVCVLACETSRLLIFPLNVLFSAPGHGVSAGAALPHDREPGEAVPAADETPRQTLPAHDAGTSPCFHTRLR